MANSELQDRLAEVDRLHDRGVITDAERAVRRQMVLSTGPLAREHTAGGTAVLVLSLIGAVLGTMFGFVAIAVGGLGNEFDSGSGNQVIGLGLSAIAAAFAAAIFAGMYWFGRYRNAMAWCLTGAAIWHLISISAFAVPGFVFLALAAVFAWTGRDR